MTVCVNDMTTQVASLLRFGWLIFVFYFDLTPFSFSLSLLLFLVVALRNSAAVFFSSLVWFLVRLGTVIPEDDWLWVTCCFLLWWMVSFYFSCMALCPSSCRYYYVHQMERGIAWLGEWVSFVIVAVFAVLCTWNCREICFKIYAHKF